ncbi:MAG TPA: 50S ribosomal protein L4 [Gaiellaceae bacterium]|nr:50S ribosomal protein L4 [Gaiellaceae bacterium]
MPPTAPVLGGSGSRELDEAIFGAEVKAHLVHETVRAEANARRAGTSQTKNRGAVSGGRSKPWRQKGTGRARQGTIRAPQFEGGGHAFAKTPRTFEQKVNRKAARAAFRSALSSHVQAGSLALVDPAAFETPSTRRAAALVDELPRPIVLVCTEEEAVLAKSFRNLERVAVVPPSELEVGAVVWARSLLVSEAALPVLEGRAR